MEHEDSEETQHRSDQSTRCPTERGLRMETNDLYRRAADCIVIFCKPKTKEAMGALWVDSWYR